MSKSFIQFLTGLLVFLVSSWFCMSYFYILETNPWSVSSLSIIFSHSECGLLILFIVSFAVQKLLCLIKSHLFIFVFISSCLLKNLYAGQEATVRTRHETTDWFKIGKGVHLGCILSPCLFNLYAEYIMWNTRLDEAQARNKIAGGKINNLRCADDITLMAESEEELNSLLMKVKEESEKVGLKLSIQKTKIIASGPITSWQIDGKQWKKWQTLFGGAQKSLQMVTAVMRLKDACSLEEKLWPTWIAY